MKFIKPINTRVSAIAALLAVIALAATTALFILFKPSALKPVIPVVNANEAFIPVSQPIRFSFPHKNAAAAELKPFTRIEPELIGSWDIAFDGKAVTIDHDRNLKYDTSYTVTVAKGAPIGNGKTLNDDVSITFTTRPGEKMPSINAGEYWTREQIVPMNYYDVNRDVEVVLGDSYAQNFSGEYVVRVYKAEADDLREAYYDTFDPADSATTSKKYIRGEPLSATTLTTTGTTQTIVTLPDESGVYLIHVTTSTTKPYWWGGVPVSSLKSESFIFVPIQRIATSVKRLGDSLVLWTVDQRTATHVSDGSVVAYGLNLTDVMFRDTIDKNGLLQRTVAQNDTNKPRFLEVASGSEKVAVVLDQGWFSTVYDSDYTNQPGKFRASIYTDRPIYHPGDQVNFKAMVREITLHGLRPVSHEYILRAVEGIYGSRNIIYEKKIQTNAHGSLADTISLTRELKTGSYRIIVLDGENEIASAEFSVEFYQKPDFEVKVMLDKEAFVRGQPVKAKVKAAYFAGGPLASQPVKWRAYLYSGDQIFESQAILDAEGEAEIDIPTANFPDYGIWWWEEGQTLTIEASVSDQLGKVSSGSKSTVYHSAEFNVSISEPSEVWNLKAGPQKFTLLAKDSLTEKPRANQKLTARIVKSAWRTGKEETSETFEITTDFVGQAAFETKPLVEGSYTILIEGKDDLGNDIKRREYIWVSGDGSSVQSPELSSVIQVTPDKKSYKIGETATLTVYFPRKSGEYFWSVNHRVFKKITTDQIQNRTAKLQFEVTEDFMPNVFVHVAAFHDQDFIAANQELDVIGKRMRVTVLPEKTSAGPSEEISVRIETKDEDGKPLSAEVSMSVVDKAIFALKSDQTTDPYDSFYPRISNYLQSRDSLEKVSISGAEGGGCFLAGTKILMSDRTEKNIEDIKVGDQILTREHDLSPRLVSDTVTEIFEHDVTSYLRIRHESGELKVTDIHPMYVNDVWKNAEKIQVGDILLDKTGKHVKVLSVGSVSTDHPVKVYNLHTEKYHTFFADGIYVHNQCEGKGDGGPCPVRSNFVDTAYWNAFVETDVSGVGKITFKLPDNLTTWVAVARGATDDTSVGQGNGEFVVTKDLYIRPNLPQMLRRGDEIDISAAVHQSLGRSGTFQTHLKAEGAVVIDSARKDIEIGSGNIGKVNWKIKVSENAVSARLTFAVTEKGGKANDSLVLTLPVYSSLTRLKRVTNGTGTGRFTFNFDPVASRSESSAVLTLTPSVLAGFPDILKKLAGYPYGCVEQTMSKHLPNILLLKERKLLGLEPDADHEKKLAEGFDRLAKFQHSDGGFGWWETDETNIWMSGYVLEGLLEAQAAGVLKGRELMLDRLLDFLKAKVVSLQENEQAYIVYALSKAEPGKHAQIQIVNALIDKFLAGTVSLDLQSQGYLALAATGGYENRKRRMNEKILNSLKIDHWEMNTDWEGMKDKYSVTGVNLMALLAQGSEKDKISGIVQWLMSHREGYEGLWGSTRQSSQILLALIEYLKQTDELNPNLNYEVLLNGTRVSSGKLASNKSAAEISLPMNLIASSNALEIKTTGKGALYWTVLTSEYLPAVPADSSKALSITREYLTLDNQPLTSFKAGDLLKVRLSVNSDSAYRYAIVEDAVPSIFEPQNLALENVGGEVRAGAIRLRGWYDSLDIRDQAVSLFISYLYSGRSDYEYIARARFSGHVTAPAPRAELMYEPSKAGIGSPMKIEVK